MRIGIKYCGGCNPTDDRAAIVLALKNYIGISTSVETSKKGIIYDMVVILYGCESACASHKDLEAKYEKVYITSERDINKLIAIVDKLKNTKIQFGE